MSSLNLIYIIAVMILTGVLIGLSIAEYKHDKLMLNKVNKYMVQLYRLQCRIETLEKKIYEMSSNRISTK